MTVLKLLIERDDTRMQDLSENVDLSSTLLAIAEYINRHHSAVSSRIKLKLCSFCNDALGRTDALGLRKDDKVRNNLIGLILGWLQPEVRLLNVVLHWSYEALNMADRSQYLWMSMKIVVARTRTTGTYAY